jgi:putative toxin-antitoxin system antitoxin component (TIGR02293 family)
MGQIWKINIPGSPNAVVETGVQPYHFFSPQMMLGEVPREQYRSVVLDFQETESFFNFLDFTTHDIAEVMEIDPSTLFRWKKEDRKLSKALTKNLLEIDQIIAKGVRIFGTEELLAQWLQTPNHTFNGQKPATLLKNPYQIKLVDQALEAMSWGNFV